MVKDKIRCMHQNKLFIADENYVDSKFPQIWARNPQFWIASYPVLNSYKRSGGHTKRTATPGSCFNSVSVVVLIYSSVDGRHQFVRYKVKSNQINILFSVQKFPLTQYYRCLEKTALGCQILLSVHFK